MKEDPREKDHDLVLGTGIEVAGPALEKDSKFECIYWLQQQVIKVF